MQVAAAVLRASGNDKVTTHDMWLEFKLDEPSSQGTKVTDEVEPIQGVWTPKRLTKEDVAALQRRVRLWKVQESARRQKDVREGKRR